MNPQALEKELSQKQIASLYLFFKEEAFWVEKLVQKIKTVLKEKYPSLEILSWQAGTQSFEGLIAEVQSLSFFSAHRLFIVSGFEKIPLSEWEKILKAQQVNSTTFLVVNLERKDLFSKISKLLDSHARAVECFKPTLRELPSVVSGLAHQKGKKLSFPNAKRIVELIGSDLLTLENQLELLCCYSKDREELELDAIEALFSETSEKNVFHWSETLTHHQIEKCFRLLDQLLKQGEVPLKLFALLSRHYRLLLKAKLLEKKGPSSGLAAHLKLPPFVAEQYSKSAKLWSFEELQQIFKRFQKTDLAFKSSPIPSSAVLEGLSWELLWEKNQ